MPLGKYIAAYKSLRKYRTGLYASEYARNNLRNILFIAIILAVVVLVDIFVFNLVDGAAAHRVISVWTLFISLLVAVILLGYYLRKPVNVCNRYVLRNVFFCLTIMVSVLLIYTEVSYRGTLYNYMMIMLAVTTMTNFRIRETVFLVSSIDAITVAAGIMSDLPRLQMDFSLDFYRIIILFSLLCLSVAVRNHIDYLLLMKERSHLKIVCETDPLTGLLNRRGMETYIRSRHYQWTVIACIFDIDDFKKYNDTYGHEAGDRCLLEVTECLGNMVEGRDCIVMRYGGEEFVALFFSDDVQYVMLCVDECMRDLAARRLKSGEGATHGYVTLSGGLAVSGEHPRRMDDYYKLIAEADAKLYAAKESGKQQVLY